MKQPEFPNWPEYSAQEAEIVTEVLRSGRVNYWTGEQGRLFEQEFAAYHDVSHGIAVSNGSVALGIALRALELPANAEVIVTPRTFIASVSEILLAGATPVFADVDRDSQNLTAESIEAVLSDKTAAVLVVHLAGWPCDMPAITELARKRNIYVIEDCAQAHGAAIGDKKIGSWGDIAAFSFCQDKIMTTGGEGGMILTGSDRLADYCWSFKDHGKSAKLMSGPSDGSGFRWVHERVGTNLRMTEMQSAIGRHQLKHLEQSIEQRNINARILHDRFKGINGLRTPWPADEYSARVL